MLELRQSAIACVAVIAALLCFVPRGAAAAWTLSFGDGRPPNPILESWFIQPNLQYPLGLTVAPSSIEMIWEHSSFFIHPSLATDPSVFPGSCRSASDDQYGWNRYNQSILTRVGVSSKRITLTLSSVLGYTTMLGETVRCGPLRQPDGSGYWFGDGFPAADEYIQFTISQASNLQFSVYNKQSRPHTSNSPVESDMRYNGFDMYMYVGGDNWAVEKIPQIIAGWSCSTGCFDSIIQVSDWFLWYPNVVALRLDRERMRLFNVPAAGGATFTWTPPNSGQVTMKNIVWPIAAALRTITITPVSTPSSNIWFKLPNGPPADRVDPYNIAAGLTRVPTNHITITEACLRGTDTDLSTCPGAIYFETPSEIAPCRGRFALRGDATRRDWRRYGLRSPQFPFETYHKWFGDQYQGATWSTCEENQMALMLDPLPEYEIWNTDTISVSIQYSLMFSLEWPTPDPTPLKITVTPSSGEIFSSATTMPERTFWEDGFTILIEAEGESFNDDVPANFLGFTSGNLPPTETQRWDAHKMNILPPGSVRFGVSTIDPAKANYSQLHLNFVKNLDFKVFADELVTITFTQANVRSGLPFTVGAGMQFLIKPSAPRIVYMNKTVFEEREVWSGNFSFDLEMNGAYWKTDAPSTCLEDLPNAWVSNITDPNGWRAPATRLALSNGSFTVLTTRLVRFTANSIPLSEAGHYDTIRGEKIGLSIPDSCVTGTTPLENRNGFEEIEIRPEPAQFELQKGSTSTPFEAISDLSEGLVRFGDFALRIDATLDTFDTTRATLAHELRAAIVSDGTDSFGFNAKKASLLGAITITPAYAEIQFLRDTTYDIAVNETITIELRPEWMTSRRVADAFSLRSVQLVLFASAGFVSVERWFGADGRPVTEDDLRWGRVWFEFGLLGDQWRREVQPFTKIFDSDQNPPPAQAGVLPARGGLAAMVDALIPNNVKFLNFTVTNDGFEYLRLQLQGSDRVDVSSTESVAIEFTTNVVASGIKPLFIYGNGTVLPTFLFKVLPTPGRLFMTGATASLDEKQLRQSTSVVWFLTLVGETWAADAAERVVLGFTAEGSGAGSGSGSAAVAETSGFNAQRSQLLPPAAVVRESDTVLRLTIAPQRTYEIKYPETIVFAPDFSTATPAPPVVPTDGSSSSSASSSAGGAVVAARTVAAAADTADDKGEDDAAAKERQRPPSVTAGAPQTAPTRPASFIEPAPVYERPTTFTLGDTAVKGGAGSRFLEPLSAAEEAAMPLEALEARRAYAAATASASTFVTSSLAPASHAVLRMSVEPTGGEVRLQSTLSLTDQDLRTKNITVEIAIDGDSWSGVVHTREAELFFGSKSSLLSEPQGFLQHRTAIVPSKPTITGSVLSVVFQATPAYDIRNDETVTFTVSDASFMETGILPDPATVSFTVKAVPRTLVLLIDESLDATRLFRGKPATFVTAVASMLSVAETSVVGAVNATALTPEGLLVMVLTFDVAKSAGTPTAAVDLRSNAELVDSFMALSPPYLYEKLGARQWYFQDSPPATGTTVQTPAPVVDLGPTSPEATSALNYIAWIGGTIVFFVVGGLTYFGCMNLQRARLSVALQKTDNAGRYEELGALQKARDDEGNDATVKELKSETMLQKKQRIRDESKTLKERRREVKRLQRAAREKRKLAAALVAADAGDAAMMASSNRARKVGFLEDPSAYGGPRRSPKSPRSPRSPLARSDDELSSELSSEASSDGGYDDEDPTVRAERFRAEVFTAPPQGTLSNGAVVQAPMDLREYARRVGFTAEQRSALTAAEDAARAATDRRIADAEQRRERAKARHLSSFVDVNASHHPSAGPSSRSPSYAGSMMQTQSRYGGDFGAGEGSGVPGMRPLSPTSPSAVQASVNLRRRAKANAAPVVEAPPGLEQTTTFTQRTLTETAKKKPLLVDKLADF